MRFGLSLHPTATETQINAKASTLSSEWVLCPNNPFDVLKLHVFPITMCSRKECAWEIYRGILETEMWLSEFQKVESRLVADSAASGYHTKHLYLRHGNPEIPVTLWFQTRRAVYGKSSSNLKDFDWKKKKFQKILMCLETQMQKVADPLQLCSSLQAINLEGMVLWKMWPF